MWGMEKHDIRPGTLSAVSEREGGREGGREGEREGGRRGGLGGGYLCVFVMRNHHEDACALGYLLAASGCRVY